VHATQAQNYTLKAANADVTAGTSATDERLLQVDIDILWSTYTCTHHSVTTVSIECSAQPTRAHMVLSNCTVLSIDQSHTALHSTN
jgi:hypothetical protein